MDKFKNLTDAELIKLLRDYGIQHGPIVDSTRTLYEKRLYEFESKKKTYPSSAESSYESRQQYSTKQYDDNKVPAIKLRLRSEKANDKGELPSLNSEVKLGAGTSRDSSRLDFPQPCGELCKTESNLSKEENPIDVNQQQKKGTRRPRQKKGINENKEKQEAMVTTQQLGAASPVMAACSASASTLVETQMAEVNVSPSTSSPSKAKQSRRSTQGVDKQEPMGAPTMQRPPEEKPSYFLAMSLVPYLDKVPEDKMADLHRDLIQRITSYQPSTPPKPPTPSAPPKPPKPSAPVRPLASAKK